MNPRVTCSHLQLVVLAAVALSCSRADKLYFERARVATTENAAREVGNAATLYCARTRHWPAEIGDMVSPRCQGALCILDAVPRDGFGNEFEGKPTGAGFVVTSAGPDGKWLSEDDIRYTAASGCAMPK